MTKFSLKSLHSSFFALLALLFTAVPAMTSCEDNAGKEDNSEFTNQWKERNAQYFAERMSEAKAAISEAKATYGNNWKEHCDWRTERSWAKVEAPVVGLTDSICYRIVNRPTGSEARPLYSDSVRVNYIGRLIPTASYSEGRVFDHSGLYDDPSSVFSPDFCIPSKFAVSNLVEGYTTLLHYLRVGERVRVYLPQELAYGSVSNSVMPAYSTLVFDVELKGIWRAGQAVGSWN